MGEIRSVPKSVIFKCMGKLFCFYTDTDFVPDDVTDCAQECATFSAYENHISVVLDKRSERYKVSEYRVIYEDVHEESSLPF